MFCGDNPRPRSAERIVAFDLKTDRHIANVIAAFYGKKYSKKPAKGLSPFNIYLLIFWLDFISYIQLKTRISNKTFLHEKDI